MNNYESSPRSVSSYGTQAKPSFRDLALKSAVFVTAFSMVFSVFMPIAKTAQANHDPFNGQVFVKENKNHKVDICHAPEGQGGAKYNQQNVSIDSIVKNNGHDSHSSDVIPPFHYKEKNNSQNVISYSGKNWNSLNEAIWNADCKVAKLTLLKKVQGGDALATSWTLNADGPVDLSGATGTSAVSNKTVPAAQYTLSETGPSGYSASNWECVNKSTQPVAVTGGNIVTLTDSSEVTCTITNTFIDVEIDPCLLDNIVNEDCNPDPCDELTKNLLTNQVMDCNPCDLESAVNNPDCNPDPCDPNIVASKHDSESNNENDNCPKPKKRYLVIKKVWQGFEGEAGPSNKGEIQVNVNSDLDEEECDYDKKGEFSCKIRFTEGTTVSIDEENIPAGWTVDQSTVGDIVPNCDEDSEDDNVGPFKLFGKKDDKGDEDDKDDKDDKDCTHTIVNVYKPAEPCGTELVANGNFELPEVKDGANWEVFPSGTPGMGWSVNWVRESKDSPVPANMELHEGVNGWLAHSSNQYAELDSDWGGPSSNQNGEDASVVMYQDLITVPGGTYTVSLWTSPRPGQGNAQNKTEVKMGSTLLDTIIEDGSSNSNTVWTKHTYSFVAEESMTRLSITDLGVGNTLGGFVDDVSVKQDCLSNVTICKYDNTETPLSNWNVLLKGDLLETVTVNSNSSTGANSVNALESGQDYLVEVSGTWQNRTFETVDASYTTPDSWSTVLPAPQGGYPDDLLETQINGNFVNWGPYSSGHKYQLTMAGNGSTANFRVFDGDANTNTQFPDWFGDNIGSLTVKIYPVYQGITGVSGCVTLENVPYNSYKLDEIMQAGWENQSGQNTTSVVDSSTETFNLVNKCTGEECRQTKPQLHLIKVVCDDFSDIQGNYSADEYDDTNGNYVHFNNYPEFNNVVKPVNPEEIPSSESGCETRSGWSFTLSSDQNQDQDVQTVTTGESGEYVGDLPESGVLWVSEVMQKGYDFGAIRCYNDALNGDNLEFINLEGDLPANVYCIAYNIEQIVPCEVTPIYAVSGAATQFLGLKEGSAPTDLKNPADYSGGSAGAVPVTPTGYAGAWDGSALDPIMTALPGAVYVSNDTVQPTFGGGAGHDGSVDSWRLFSDTFTIPAGATGISSPSLHFAADNEVSVFFDDVLIGSSASFGSVTSVALPSLTPGTHTLKFAVKNYAFDQTNNPTGVIYKLDTITYDCDSHGDSHRNLAGMVYLDEDQDETKDPEENPIEGLTVKLIRATADDEDEDLNLEEEEIASDVSDVDGNYSFSDVADGCYILREVPGSYQQTEPPVTHEYYVKVGDADCNFNLVTFADYLFKTANAADSSTVFVAYTGQPLNFGNFLSGGSNGGGSRGGSSGGSTPLNPQVLGDTTTVPSVLGATTELPRTGSPISVLFVLITLLSGAVLAPKVLKITR